MIRQRCCKIRSSFVLLLGFLILALSLPSSSVSVSAFQTSFRQCSHHPQQGGRTIVNSVTGLSMTSNNRTLIQERVWIHDAGILTADLLALAVGCQLLGLLDALNDPTFDKNGGWFQPLQVPATLPRSMERFSINSICWVTAGILGDSFRQLDRTTSLSTTTLAFVVLRVIVGVIEVSLVPIDLWDHGLDVLRQLYVVALCLATSPYLVYQLYDK